MKLEYTHTPVHGKSIIEKIRDQLDATLESGTSAKVMSHCDHCKAEGLALALGLLRGSSQSNELSLAEARMNR